MEERAKDIASSFVEHVHKMAAQHGRSEMDESTRNLSVCACFLPKFSSAFRPYRLALCTLLLASALCVGCLLSSGTSVLTRCLLTFCCAMQRPGGFHSQLHLRLQSSRLRRADCSCDLPRKILGRSSACQAGWTLHSLLPLQFLLPFSCSPPPQPHAQGARLGGGLPPPPCATC